jgi:hypothetical protein
VLSISESAVQTSRNRNKTNDTYLKKIFKPLMQIYLSLSPHSLARVKNESIQTIVFIQPGLSPVWIDSFFELRCCRSCVDVLKGTTMIIIAYGSILPPFTNNWAEPLSQSSAGMADSCPISLKWCFLLPPSPHSFSRSMSSAGQLSKQRN